VISRFNIFFMEATRLVTLSSRVILHHVGVISVAGDAGKWIYVLGKSLFDSPSHRRIPLKRMVTRVGNVSDNLSCPFFALASCRLFLLLAATTKQCR